MDFLEGGSWDRETYAPGFIISMNGFSEKKIPNIIRLASPYGRLKSLAETQIAMSIAIRDAAKEGKIVPARCWDWRAIP